MNMHSLDEVGRNKIAYLFVGEEKVVNVNLVVFLFCTVYPF